MRQLMARVAAFGVVGVLAGLTDFAVFNVLSVPLGMNPLPAKVISTIAGAVVAYVGNRYWSFRDRVRTAVRREFVLFFVLNAIGLAIAEGCLAFTVYVLDDRGPVATNIAASGFGFVLSTAFRFWAYGRFVFLRPVTDSVTSPEAADPVAVAAAPA